MSSSPDPDRGSVVLRGTDASELAAARFDVDLRGGERVPEELLSDAHAGAHAAGYAAGWAQGQQHAHEAAKIAAEVAAAEARQVAERQESAVDAAVRTVAAAADRLERRAIPVAAELEELILRTAMSIAEAVLGRELAVAEAPGLDALRRAMALAPTDRPVTVRLNPTDHAALAGRRTKDHQIDGRQVSLLADPTLRRGDAIAESDITTVDARLDAALQRVRKALES
ncbi:MAG: flagellar assembly protein [Actinobacteria bacterium]|nr:flagellar assembly protein [Actinomycetota bacterium]